AMEGPVRWRRARYKGPAAPPWKETYRRRCMERLRSSRAKLLDRYRRAGERVCGPAAGALLVQEVMELEWQGLQESPPDPGGKEALAQMPEDPDELAVLEEIQQELILQGNLSVNDLTVRNHLVFCQCGLYISTQGMTEEKLRSLLENTVTEHSHRCFHNPEFTVTSGMEEEASLLMSCPVSLNPRCLE
ncbi:RIPA protein, partial [Glareola pratincola]|nr:RIPA protein [Glareola pratincola]